MKSMMLVASSFSADFQVQYYHGFEPGDVIGGQSKCRGCTLPSKDPMHAEEGACTSWKLKRNLRCDCCRNWDGMEEYEEDVKYFRDEDGVAALKAC